VAMKFLPNSSLDLTFGKNYTVEIKEKE